MDAVLRCPSCSSITPAVFGFPLFTETEHGVEAPDEPWLLEQCGEWFRTTGYTEFLAEKARRGLRDSYALFQPFNESSRALIALLQPLAEKLKPGDLILDTWCRTGWTGEWLAALFPEQYVISVWEGNNNVLGYSGFHYWLPESARSSNLSILFTPPDNAFPLKTDIIKLVVGLDSLHRYELGIL